MTFLHNPSWSNGKLPLSGGVGVNTFWPKVIDDIDRNCYFFQFARIQINGLKVFKILTNKLNTEKINTDSINK